MVGERYFRIAVIFVALIATALQASIPAFPGADGAGAKVTGGRGGMVYHVTKLDLNYSDNREGTLRYGLNDNNFPYNTPRTLVFDVAGTFWLGRYGAERGHNNGWDTQSRLNLGSNVTVAGETAPGPVYIMGGVVKAGNDNVIIRNVTICPGYGMRSFEKPDEGVLPTEGDFPDSYVYDAIDISGREIMISHVTCLYATDECISANERARDITMQYCNISQGQNYPQADAEGEGRYTGHALASLLQAGSNARLSMIRNLYAHQKGRVPRVGSEEGTGPINDFRNNVIYNWFGTAGTGASGQPSQNNFLSNFYLVGPGGDDVSGPSVVYQSGGTEIFNGYSSSATKAFVSGNLRDSNSDEDPNDGISADSRFSNVAAQGSPYVDDTLGLTLTANEAFVDVMSHMGACWWKRDFTPTHQDINDINTPDERLVYETLTGTGRIMAWADDPFDDDPCEGTEWRELLALRADTSTGEAPFNREENWDTDQDGLPNAWEIQHGLPVDVANNNGDFDKDGYTDLEEYLNDIAAWPAPGPIVFIAQTTRYEEIGNWLITGNSYTAGRGSSLVSQLQWQPSRYDTVIIDDAIVEVNSVGQHAGILYLGTETDSAASLTITEGWLKVADQLIIGNQPEATATLNLSGGALYTGLLSKGENGTLSLNGGLLQANQVTFDLTNNGATLAPEGTMQINGDLNLNSGVVALTLHSPEQFDTLIVDGQARLGGQLQVSLAEGYIPEANEVFEIVTASSCHGVFDDAVQTVDVGTGTFQATYTDTTAQLSDFTSF